VVKLFKKNIKVEILSVDGSIRYLEVYGSEILWDGKLQLELIYKDVTESTQAEKRCKRVKKIQDDC